STNDESTTTRVSRRTHQATGKLHLSTHAPGKQNGTHAASAFRAAQASFRHSVRSRASAIPEETRARPPPPTASQRTKSPTPCKVHIPFAHARPTQHFGERRRTSNPSYRM